MATRIVPKTHLRDRIRDELADLKDDTLVVTDRGRPSAVLVSVERWNVLQETLEDLQDTLAVLEHRASRDAPVPAESVFAAIEAEQARVPGSGRQAG
ncbi:MAG TPA: type II toxin-antitoxin system prevent-host-death family antitoxin [Acidimicrobiales bacterium]